MSSRSGGIILKTALSLLTVILSLTWTAAWAKTPDGKPPSVETVCDGLSGAAFGLCNAYCEAMDCDSPNHRASDTACEQVKSNYERHTGQPLPCEVSCPCSQHFPLFAQLAEGSATVDQCLQDTQVISVVTSDQMFALVNDGVTPPYCSVNLEPPFLELTSQEATACEVLLHNAAAAQGVACVPPE
jgi:hypothetical protein